MRFSALVLMKKGMWVGLALAIGVAGAWGYGALVRQENDDGRRVHLLALAEEQHLDLSFTRSGRLVTRVPDEGESIRAGDAVAKLEEPGLAEDIADLERQMEQVAARENARQQAVAGLEAQFAQTVSEEKRLTRLNSEGIAAAADLETLQHKREELAAGVRAREAEKGQLEAEANMLRSRIDKIHRFEREGALASPATGTVLTRYHREGEYVAAGDPILTLQVDTPYLRVEVPEERLSVFQVGKTVRVWPQARSAQSFAARVLSIKPRSEFATRRNWGMQSRDLKTFSVRLKPEGAAVVSGQTFVVEAGS
jgi:HlyD family secretion protein